MAETVEQISQPWEKQVPYLTDIYGQAQDFFGNRSQYYPGQTYLELNELQQAGLDNQLNYGTGGTMNDILGHQTGTYHSMLNAPDVANNPYIAGVADVMQTRLNRNMNENVLPNIQGNFNMVGQYGGDRSDVFRQAAGRDTQEAYAQGLAGLYGDAYKTGLDQQARGMALTPQVQAAGFVPSQTQSQVGSALQQEAYRPLQEDIARYNYNQQSPWNDLTQYVAAVGGIPISQGYSRETDQQSNPWGSALAGGLLGYANNSGINKAFGSDFSPWTTGIGGALLGGLGSSGGLF
jgi:hypothetical protein